MKRLVSNIAAMAKARVICLLVLALLVGANNVTWGQVPTIVNSDKNMTYSSKGTGTLWTDANNWNASYGNATGFFPGQKLYRNNPYGNFGGGKVTVNREIIMPNMSSYYYADYRKMQNPSFDTIFNIQSLTLDGNANLTLNDDLFLTGSGADDTYVYKGGTLRINEGASLIVCKRFKLEKNQEITGGGKLIIFNQVYQSSGKILTADVDVEIAPKNDNPAKIEHNTLGDAISINVLKSLTITRQTDVTKNNTKLEFADIVVKPNATVTINNNKDGKQTVSSSTFKMEGGTLEIATGSKLSVTGGEKVLTVTGEAVLKGNGTLDVKKIDIATDAILTIDGTRTFDGIEFTGPGALRVADGGALTLNNTTFSGDVTILKGETGTGTLTISGNIAGGTNSTLKTEVNTTLAAVGEFNGITTINIAAGTFTNNRLTELANIVVADGATFSTRGIGVTNLLTLQGTLTGNNAITFTGSTVTFGENTSIATGSMVEINSNATISGLASCLDGRAEIQTGKDISYVSSTHVLAADYGTLTIDGGVVTLCGASTVASTFTTSNDVTLSGANFMFNSAISGGKTITANGITMTVDGDGAVDAKFAVTGNGTLNYNRANNLAELNVASGSTVAFGSSVTVADPTLLGTVSVASDETLMLSGDITFGANTTITSGSDVQIASGSTINGLASCLNVTVANNAEISYGTESGIILGGNYSNLTVSANAELCDNVTVSGVFEVANSAAISGGYELSLNGVINGADKTLTADGITLNIGGAVVDAAVQPQLAVTGGGTLNYDRTTALSALNVASDGTANFGESVNATNATLEGAVSVDNTQTLTLDGTINFGANTTIGGEGSVHVASGSTVGNLVKCLDGVEIVADNEGHKNITYESTSTYVWSDTYFNITIGGDVTLCGDVTVENVLTWNAGNITLAGHELALTSSSAAISGNTTFGSTHMIVVGKDGAAAGTLKISNLSALLFPVGTTQGVDTQYSPVEITSGVSSNGANAWVGVTSVNAIVPSGSPLNLKRWWDIDAENISVSNAAMTFKYDADDSDTELFSALTQDGVEVSEDFDTENNIISASGLSTIIGRWTAVDNGIVYYSRTDEGATTDWSKATTWTLNPDGSNSGNTEVPSASDNVEILAGANVTIDIADAKAKSVKIVGTLNYGENTPAFRLVYGTGTLTVDGTQDFSKIANSRDYTQFMSAEGGTVELRGDFSSQAYWDFNNLVLNNDNSVTSVSPNNATILGNLTLTGSDIAFAGTGSMTVGGNIIIGENQKLTFSGARTVSAAVIDASASGASVSVAENVTIDGSVKLLGTFDVAENMALTLNAGTAAETNATFNSGNVVLANGGELAGKLTFADLTFNSTASVSGAVNVNNNLNTPVAATILGRGSISVKNQFTVNSVITTYADITIVASNEDINASFVVGGGATLTNDRGCGISSLTINDGGTFVALKTFTIDNLSMNGSNATLKVKNKPLSLLNSTLSGNIITSDGGKIIFRGNVDFSGTAVALFSGVFEAATNVVSISNLGKCLGNEYSFTANTTITYSEGCSYMLSGTYASLNVDVETIKLCGNITATGNLGLSLSSTTIDGEGAIRSFVVEGNVSGASGRAISFSNVNATIGKESSNSTLSISGIGIANNSKLTFAGNVVKSTTSYNLTIGGGGDIILNGSLNVTGGNLNFSNNQLISGNGTLTIEKGISAPTFTITTTPDVIIKPDATINVGEFVVNGGTFTYNNTNTLNKVTVNSGAEFVAADNTTVKDMSVNAGTITIADGATLKVSETALQVAGNTIITSGGASSIEASNVELAADANLTINKGITLNNALVVNNNATITGGTDATLAWATPAACKISAHSATLTLANTIGIASDITLDGKLCVVGTLNLGAANVTFTEATNFAGTTGDINFSADAVTINDLTVNPNAPTTSVHFRNDGAVTYAASCTSMLPGEYNNLTLNTEAKKNIALFDDATVNGTLSWANGRIALSGKTLTVNQAFAGTFSGDHMIVMSGNSQIIYKNNTGAAQSGLTLTMPIGTTSTTSMGAAEYSYSPATLSELSSIAVDGTVGVNVKGEALRGTSSDLVRYWTVSSSDAAMTGTLAFTYVGADDINGYGVSDDEYWSVLHKVADADIHYIDKTSPYASKIISISATEIANKDDDAGICGIWTAIEYPPVVTLYSYKTGNWGESDTWTLESTGSVPNNPDGLTPNRKTDVVILQGDVISTASADGISARSVTLKHESSKLQIEAPCQSGLIKINNLSGEGVLRIEGRGDFPVGIKNSDKFMAADGGTTEFYGTPSTSPFTLQQMKFNNLKINFAVPNIVMQVHNGSTLLTINGNLEIDNGKLEFTKNGQTIDVKKKITIERDGEIGIGASITTGNKTNYVTLQVGGDLINNGNLKLTRRYYGGYTQALAEKDEGADGRGILRLVGECDARFECRNKETNISQLVIDKGTGQKYVVTLDVDQKEHFGLTGRANEVGAGFDNQDNPPQILKPLWIKNGTLELTGDVHFKSLSQGGTDNAFIPLNGCLHLNGDNVLVDVCIDGTNDKCLMPAGKVLISKGKLDCKTGAGVVFRNTSEIVIEGGELRGSQFRPSQYTKDGKTSFIMTGGKATFDGNGEMKNAYSTFYMPFDNYTFQMSGGLLDIYSAQNSNGGAFVVNCNPGNSHITGGKIRVTAKDAKNNNSDTYTMISSIPLYDFELANENKPTYTHIYKNFTGTVNGVAVSVVPEKLYVTNDLIIGSGVTFEIGDGKSVEVGGNLIIESGATVKTRTGNIMFNGGEKPDPQQLRSNGATIWSGASNNVAGFYSITVDENSKLQVMNSITVNDMFTLGEGAELQDGADNNVYTMNGDVEIEGTHAKRSPGAGKMVLKGTTIYSMGNGVLNNVDIDNGGAELKLLDPNNEDRQTKLTITGDLNFVTASRFNIGSSNLELSVDATVSSGDGVFDNTRMIQTVGASSRGVTRFFSETKNSFTFPFGIGIGANYYYTPATITYTGASKFGKVTTRPVSGYAFRNPESLNCYWISEDAGFEDVTNLTQTYQWFGDGLGTATPTWCGGRHIGGAWDLHDTRVSIGTGSDRNERHITFSYPTVKSVNGYYSCGLIDDFIDGGALYSAGSGSWSTQGIWSKEYVGGPTCNDVPGPNTIVVIGDENNYHTITLDDNNLECASLSIAPGSTLDVGKFIGFVPAIVEVDEAIGAGTIRIDGGAFPNNGNNFEKFNGEYGGTVEYYIDADNDEEVTYTIPAAPANYCNLIISGGNVDKHINMPNGNISIFNNFTVNGYVRSAYSDNHTINIGDNWNIVGTGTFEMWHEDTKSYTQTYVVKEDVVVESGARMIANGATKNNNSNIVKIEGNLTVDGILSAAENNNRFNVVFVGSKEETYIGGSATTYNFNELECDKSSIDNKLILTNSNVASTTDALLKLTKGTFEIATDGAKEISLSKANDLEIPLTARLSVASGSARVASGGNERNLNLYGEINISGGSLYVGKGNHHSSIFYAPSGLPRITISGGELVVVGQISRFTKQATGALAWEQSGGDVQIMAKQRYGTNDNDGLKVRGAFEIINNTGSKFEMSGGTITINNGGGVDTYGDIYLHPSSSSCTGGTIIADCPGDSLKLMTNINLHDIEIRNNSKIKVYNDLDVNSLVIDNTGVYKAEAHKLTIRSAFVNHNTQYDDLLNKTSKGFLPGSADQLTIFEGADMQIEGYGDVATQFGQLKIDGNLTMTEGCTKIRVANDLTQLSGTVKDNGNTITLFGDLMYYGSFEGSGGINFVDKNAIQTIGGSGLGSIGTVIVNNPNEVYLNTNLTITKKLELGSNLYISRNLVTLGVDAVVVPAEGKELDNTHMIRLDGQTENHGVTKIVKKSASAFSFTLPIGITGHYTPATYNFASNDNEGATINVRTVNALHKNLSVAPSKWLNYYWMVKTTGFGDETRDISVRTANFSVEQIYTFTDGKVEEADGNTGDLLPEYMFYGGINEYEWINLSGENTARVVGNDIIFDAFGHIAGDYTAGIVNSSLPYTGLPVLYTRAEGPGIWENAESWEYKISETEWKTYEYAPNGNPIHIRPGHTISMSTGQKAYCLYFDKTDKEGNPDETLGTLDIGSATGCNFGHVDGVGHLRMEPSGNNYKMPAGDFEEFLNSPRSIIEFSGGSGQLPNSIVGHVSQPLQNVILSGGGVKTLTKEDGEYINGWLQINSGTTLNYGNTPIIIKGNWIDLNTSGSGYEPGNNNDKSIVEFCGTTEQEIQLSNNSSSFWNMKVSNPEGVTLVKKAGDKANVTIGYKLILNGGCVNTTDDSHLIIAESATTSGASETAFVNGPLSKKMAKAGASFVYPVGDGTEYAPTELGNVSGAYTYTVTFHKNDLYNGRQALRPLTTASKNEYWTIASDNGTAKAKLKLRVGRSTIEEITNAVLDRVSVAGMVKSGVNKDMWEKIASTYTGGTIPNATVQTDAAIAINGHESYTIGFASTTARLLDPFNDVEPERTAICDGDAVVNEKTNIPVYLTGKGGPYTLGYKVSFDGVDKTSSISITPNDDGVAYLSFTGNELGAMFGQAEGFKADGSGQPMAYTISLESVSEGGVAGVAEKANKAIVTVYYNAVPEITGQEYVGMEDKRLYSVATSDWDDEYLWSSNKAKATIADATIANAEITFARGDGMFTYTEYSVTLTATQSYRTLEVGKTCSRANTMLVTVMNKPQPDIKGVVNATTGDAFIACKASTASAPYSDYDKYTYWTETVGTHSYEWGMEGCALVGTSGNTRTYEAGIIYDYNKNECQVVWFKNYGNDYATLVVTETSRIGYSNISNDTKRMITLRDNFAFDDDDFTIPGDACNNAQAEVRILKPNGLSYQIYNSDGVELSPSLTLSGSEPANLGTNSSLGVGNHSLKVLVSNGGCSRPTAVKTLKVRETPTLKGDNLSLNVDDMYIGNLAQLNWEKTSSVAPNNYSFAYGSDGVVYTSGNKPDDFTGNFVTGRTIKIEVPKADKMKGVLTVKDDGANNKICSSTYEIAEQAISQDYLWRGTTDDWNEKTNWWAGEIPGKGTNVVVREGKKITKDSDSSDDTPLDLPKVAAEDAVVKNIKLESGSIEVDSDKKLTINGNVESAGEFTGSGTVEFSNGDHTVQGSSVTFANLTNNGAVIANNPIAVKGALNNAGSFTGSVVEIDGGEGQQIKGNGSFYDITFSNSNVVEVVDVTTIHHALVMNGGVVKADNQIIIGSEGSMSGSSWVNGEVKKLWGDTRAFDFKIGGAEHAAPVRVTPTASGAEFTASYAYDGSKPAITDKELIGSMERVSVQETWNIDGNSGSYITLYWSDFSGVTQDDGLYIAHQLKDGTWEKLEGDISGNSITTKEPVSRYSAFSFGATNADPTINPLPVTFVAFTGRQEGNTIVLDWATASENDNNYFEIERSIDGVNYVTIGYVDGAGNSSSLLGYQFTDNAPEQGQLYYRLSQVDFDGNREYADKVVAVLYTGSEIENLTIVPNPTEGLFKVSASGSMAGGRIELLSQSGQVVRIVNVDSFDATIDISDLPSGIYILRFVTDAKVLQQKVVKY